MSHGREAPWGSGGLASRWGVQGRRQPPRVGSRKERNVPEIDVPEIDVLGIDVALLWTHANNKRKCGHKIDHNSSSRPPFDIKHSASDRIFHARFIGNSFECGNLQNKAVLKQFSQF